MDAKSHTQDTPRFNSQQQTKTAPTVLILGGTGFIGRHIAAAAQRKGAQILIGTRGETNATYRTMKLHEMTNAEHWESLLDEADVVVNAVGILRQRRGESYEQVHHHALSVLAKACEKKDVRLIHVSALGLENKVRSRFLTSKRRGERALMHSDCDWAIVRPSLVDGIGGFGAKWLRRSANWPVHFAPSNALGIIAPVNASDLGEAIANIALHRSAETDKRQRIYELGGDQEMNLFEYQRVLGKQPPHKRRIAIPAWIARCVAHVCDILHVTPFSFGHYELLKFNNCPKQNRLREVLGRAPTPLFNQQIGKQGRRQRLPGLRPVTIEEH